MSRPSGPCFAERLARLAAHTADPRCSTLTRRLRQPVTVAVQGRPGVGTRTVARALTAAGLAVRTEPGADIGVRVIAEVVKPEDVAACAAAAGPTVLVLNKADLAGFGDGGPLAVSQSRAAEVARRTGLPAEPLVALLAVAALEPPGLDDELLRAVRVLVDTPADLSSADAFVAGPHPLPAVVRRRMVEHLDLFGIAHLVLAVDSGESWRGLLRRVSRIDAVCARIDAAAAEVRYRRLLAVVAELAALAARAPEVAEFLAADETVAARTAAAAEVITAAGLPVDLRAADAAPRWRRYGSGPVSPLHRAAATDLVRGSLRLPGAA